MKKITLLVCALATVVTAFATTRRAYQTVNASRSIKMNEVKIEPVKPASFKNVEEIQDESNPLLWVRSYAPNAFHYGSNSNGALPLEL